MVGFVPKYGSTRVEVNIDGSFSYADHANDVKENGRFVFVYVYKVYNLCNSLPKFLSQFFKNEIF